MRDYVLQFFVKIGDLLVTMPVNPEQLEVNKGKGYDTYSNLDDKDRLKLGSEKLLSIKFESIFEETNTYNSVTDTPHTPVEYIDMFERIRNNSTEVRLTSSDGIIDMFCYLINIEIHYKRWDT